MMTSYYPTHLKGGWTPFYDEAENKARKKGKVPYILVGDNEGNPKYGVDVNSGQVVDFPEQPGGAKAVNEHKEEYRDHIFDFKDDGSLIVTKPSGKVMYHVTSFDDRERLVRDLRKGIDDGIVQDKMTRQIMRDFGREWED